MRNIAILSSHNGSGLDAIIEAINKNLLNLNIALVVSNNTNAVVLQKADKLNIKNFLINEANHDNPNEKIHALLKEYDCEYVFLSGYMKKLPSRITRNFKVINSHPSLLPKYGGKGMYGRFVHEAVIQNKETFSGVTIHEVNGEYDDGNIILQETIALSENESANTLESKIKALEKIAIVNGLQKCLN
jgi:phosphoribosylglycinamide formyltransferase 1